MKGIPPQREELARQYVVCGSNRKRKHRVLLTSSVIGHIIRKQYAVCERSSRKTLPFPVDLLPPCLCGVWPTRNMLIERTINYVAFVVVFLVPPSVSSAVHSSLFVLSNELLHTDRNFHSNHSFTSVDFIANRLEYFIVDCLQHRARPTMVPKDRFNSYTNTTLCHAPRHRRLAWYRSRGRISSIISSEIFFPNT